MSDNVNKRIRQFITNSFDDGELDGFCYDNFVDVYNDFTLGMAKSQKVQMLLAYCVRHNRRAALLEALKEERPELYKDELAPLLEAHQWTQTADSRLRTRTRAGIELVYIPAGPYLSGDDAKAADLPAYWIGRTPVTNRQFNQFVVATGYLTKAERKGEGWVYDGYWQAVKGANWQHPEGPSSNIQRRLGHPVVQVTWNDADEFAKWAGYRLPTEDEWEKAARGTDDRLYPWGNQRPNRRLCNFGGDVGGTTPVGRYSPAGDSPYGCVDMVGNVWEWTNTWASGRQTDRIIRGGAWQLEADFVRVTERLENNPNRWGNNSGFRIAADPWMVEEESD